MLEKPRVFKQSKILTNDEVNEVSKASKSFLFQSDLFPNKLTKSNDLFSKSQCSLSNEQRVLVERMINRILKFNSIDGFSEAEILSILHLSHKQLSLLPCLISINAPVITFGDIHGQLSDLIRFFNILGTPPRVKFLFLGDYVDRCIQGIEVTLLLLCYKLRYSEHVHLLRGNHECCKMNRIYGFYYECRSKISVKVWKAFQSIFNELPLCARVGKRILAMHGGISPLIKNWESLEKLKKPRTYRDCDEGICLDLMWADPSRDNCTKGFQTNTDRGTSYIFGDDVISEFNEKLSIDLVVRAHEVVKKGHLFNGNDGMCTIFSAPNYCGSEGNCASVMLISKKLEISFITLRPNPNPSQKELSKEEFEKLKEQFILENAKSPKPGTHPEQNNDIPSEDSSSLKEFITNKKNIE